MRRRLSRIECEWSFGVHLLALGLISNTVLSRYVAGGFGFVQQHQCGERSCGGEYVRQQIVFVVCHLMSQSSLMGMNMCHYVISLKFSMTSGGRRTVCTHVVAVSKSIVETGTKANVLPHLQS